MSKTSLLSIGWCSSSRKRRRLREEFCHCWSMQRSFKHLDRITMCVSRKGQLWYHRMPHLRRCNLGLFLRVLHALFLFTSVVSFMMSAMTLKEVIMPGKEFSFFLKTLYNQDVYTQFLLCLFLVHPLAPLSVHPKYQVLKWCKQLLSKFYCGVFFSGMSQFMILW